MCLAPPTPSAPLTSHPNSEMPAPRPRHTRDTSEFLPVAASRFGRSGYLVGRSPAPSGDPAHASCAEEEACGDRRGYAAPHCRTIRVVRSDGPGANDHPRRAARHDVVAGAVWCRTLRTIPRTLSPRDTGSTSGRLVGDAHHTPTGRGRGGSYDAVRSSDAGSSYSQPACSPLATTSSFDLLQKGDPRWPLPTA